MIDILKQYLYEAGLWYGMMLLPIYCNIVRKLAGFGLGGLQYCITRWIDLPGHHGLGGFGSGSGNV